MNNIKLKNRVMIVLLILISLISFSCKSINRSTESGSMLRDGSAVSANINVSDSNGEKVKKIKHQLIKESEYIKENATARRIVLSSQVPGCESVTIPVSLGDRVSQKYTSFSLKEEEPIKALISCFPYTLEVFYQCNSDEHSWMQPCFEGKSAPISIERFADIPEYIDVVVSVSPSKDRGDLRMQNVSVRIALVDRVTRLIDFLDEECMTDSSNQLISKANQSFYRLSSACLDTFYKSYTVDGFEFEMFGSNQDIKTKCKLDQSSLKSQSVLNSSFGVVNDSDIKNSYDFIISGFIIDGSSYKIDRKHPLDLLLGYYVNKSLTVEFERMELSDGKLRCYKNIKSWTNKN